MIILTPTIYSSAGPIILSDPNPGTRDLSRRVSRVATLDGGAVVNDYGYAAADRTFSVSVADEDLPVISALETMLKNYSEVLVSCASGLFLCAFQSLSASTLTLLVKEEI